MIVPMTLVRIYGPRELLDETICLLYELEALHPEALPAELAAGIGVRDRRTEDRDAVHERVEVEALYEKVRRCLLLLPHPKLETAPPAAPSSVALLHAGETRPAVDEIFQRVEALSARRKEAADRLALLAKYQKMVSAILPLVEQVGDSAGIEMVGLTVARDQQAVIPLLEEQLRRATDGLAQVFSAEVDEHAVAALVLYGRSDAAKVRSLLWDRNLSELKLPTEIERLPLRHALTEIAAQGERLPVEVREIDAELAAIAAQRRGWLEGLGASLSSRLQQLGARASFFRTRYSFVVSGWLPQSTLPRLREGLEGISAGRIVIEDGSRPARRGGARPGPAAQFTAGPALRGLPPAAPAAGLPQRRPDAARGGRLPALFRAHRRGRRLRARDRRARPRRPAARRPRQPPARSRDGAGVLLARRGALRRRLRRVLWHPRRALRHAPAAPAAAPAPRHALLLGLSVGIGCVHVFLGLGLGVYNAARAGHRAGVRHRVGQAAALAGLILLVAVPAGVIDRALLPASAALLVGGRRSGSPPRASSPRSS